VLSALSLLQRAVDCCALPIPLRVAIVGGSRTGKSTLAHRIGVDCAVQVRNTDDLIRDHDWSAVSLEVSRWLDEPGEWIIEGAAVVRALRKWMRLHPGGSLDGLLVVYLDHHVTSVTRGQATLSKGVRAIWREIEDELRARGARIVELEALAPAGAE
jgi:hypothetical protein